MSTLHPKTQQLSVAEAKTQAFATRVIHGGQTPDPVTHAVMPPISLSTTYAQQGPGEHDGYEYSRSQNPTRFAFERALAAAELGVFGFAFASGCAAATTALHLLRPGDHVLASDDLYGGTRRLFDRVFSSMGISFSYADASNASDFARHLTPATKMVWLETPSNPLLKLADIQAISTTINGTGAHLVVDNTFASPALQTPLELGASICLHSTTKYIGGHSDVVGGALICRDPALGERLGFLQNALGAVAGPFDAYLGLRGIKSLAVRMRAHCENALELANRLTRDRKIRSVRYPGLPRHPQFELARTQMRAAGGMIAVELAGGYVDADRFLRRLELFTLAESLGGVESLVEHPGKMTHSGIAPAEREALGISDTLVRLSVGIEDVEDLWKDIQHALS